MLSAGLHGQEKQPLAHVAANPLSKDRSNDLSPNSNVNNGHLESRDSPFQPFTIVSPTASFSGGISTPTRSAVHAAVHEAGFSFSACQGSDEEGNYRDDFMLPMPPVLVMRSYSDGLHLSTPVGQNMKKALSSPHLQELQGSEVILSGTHVHTTFS